MAQTVVSHLQPTPDDLLFFNGLDLSSGDYLIPPLSPADVSRLAQGQRFDPQHLSELKWRHQEATEGHYGVKEGVDYKKLEETGWGVIFAYDADPAIREALSELLTHRQKQAARIKETRYVEILRAGSAIGRMNRRLPSSRGMASGPARSIRTRSRTTCSLSATRRLSRSDSSISLMCSMPWVAFTSTPLKNTPTTPTGW